MKKLLIAACVAAFAVVAQASVVNWSTGTLYAPGTDGSGYADEWGLIDPGTSGVLATLIVGTGYSGDEITGKVAFSSGDTGSTIDDAYAISGTTSDSLDDDATYYAQMIITYGDSTLKSGIVAIETSSITGSADITMGDGGLNVTPVGFTLDDIYGAFSSSGWAAVPEPTSGLLMLLGVAGLALRRKCA